MAQMEPLSQSEMMRLLLPLLQEQGVHYRKCRNIFAKRAEGGEKIDTVTADGLETTNTAHAGDYIVRNQTSAGELYIIRSDKFAGKYAPTGNADGEWAEFRPLGEVIGLVADEPLMHILGQSFPFYFVAAWGESVKVLAGDYLVCPPNQSEIYRIAGEVMGETYEKR